MPTIAVVDLKETSYKPLMLNPYLDSLKRAGADTVLLSWNTDADYIAAAVARYDGFLFTGGSDLDPALYGEQKLPECGECVPQRDSFEQALFKAVFAAKKPIFGICRGSQSINVALGGSLWQDLPSQNPSDVTHSFKDVTAIMRTVHDVDIEKDSLLFDILGCEKFAINSMHHQAVKRLADGLSVCAKAADGVVESYEMKNYPFLFAVQWHPEHLSENMDTHQKLFDRFVSACR